jgi:hypothetical protein
VFGTGNVNYGVVVLGRLRKSLVCCYISGFAKQM